MEVVNFLDGPLEPEGDRPGREFTTARVGGDRLGASVYELAPGQRHYPYHWHHGNEELALVLAGRPTLRTPEGERVLRPGDYVVFGRGPDSAHAFRNDSDEPTRFVILSTLMRPEVVSYPDSGKMGAGSKFGRGMFREETKVDYWEGED